MRTNAAIDPTPATGQDRVSEPAGVTELTELVAALGEAERATARAVSLAGRVAGSGVCERVEGLPLEHFLGLAGRLTGADRRMLVAAGEVLRDLPATRILFAEGKLSWGQVRGIVSSVRSLPKALRAALDADLAETARLHGGIDGFDPDQLLDAVTVAAAELRDARLVERREQRRSQSDFLALQPSLEGGVQLYGQCNDPVLAATVVNALDDAADQPHATDTREPDEATTRARQYAQGLGRICRTWLAGGPADPHDHEDDADGANASAADDPDPAGDAPASPGGDHSAHGPQPGSGEDASQAHQPAGKRTGSGSDASRAQAQTGGVHDRSADDASRAQAQAGGAHGRSGGGDAGQAQSPTESARRRSSGRAERGRAARPLLIAHIDIADLTRATAATIELNVRGPLPTITLKALEQLGIDADLRAVIFDGARPLAVSRKVRAASIAADTRLAVQARDMGCRFPGSRDPIGHCDVHHLVERSRGGDHHPDNLVNLSRRHHTLTHHHGWTLTLNPTTGEVTATRRNRRWRSLPRATCLARAPDGNDGLCNGSTDREDPATARGSDPVNPFTNRPGSNRSALPF